MKLDHEDFKAAQVRPAGGASRRTGPPTGDADSPFGDPAPGKPDDGFAFLPPGNTSRRPLGTARQGKDRHGGRGLRPASLTFRGAGR